jgi:hypothetical protein
MIPLINKTYTGNIYLELKLYISLFSESNIDKTLIIELQVS